MKKIFFLWVCIVFTSKAQLPSQADNSEYGIAQKIDTKAKQLKLGAVHTESPKMRPTAGKGGWFLRYEKGWVYYNPKTQEAQGIWGDIMSKWASQGYETGWIGFPVSSHANTPNRTGSFVHFDNGSIYWSPATGSHFVGGAFREYWKSKGWENSVELGFPKTSEIEIFLNGYTRYQQFERGTLFFAAGKEVLYSNNPNATTPPVDNSTQYRLKFAPTNLLSYGDEGISVGSSPIDLYGWMDIRVYKGNGAEIVDESNKSFSIFYIPEKNRIEDVETYTLNFDANNINFQRSYGLNQTDINNNAYIRITYWLNDHDDVSSNDYLKLIAFNGSWNYNQGNHPYREIKIKDIDKNFGTLTLTDRLEEGREKLTLIYSLKLEKK